VTDSCQKLEAPGLGTKSSTSNGLVGWPCAGAFVASCQLSVVTWNFRLVRSAMSLAAAITGSKGEATRLRLRLGQGPGRPHLRHDPVVGLLVPNKFLPVRIPLQLPPQPHGDVIQVTQAGRSMADLRRGHGLFATLDAVEEIPVMAEVRGQIAGPTAAA